jgi:hypothetical protein
MGRFRPGFRARGDQAREAGRPREPQDGDFRMKKLIHDGVPVAWWSIAPLDRHLARLRKVAADEATLRI